MSTTIKIMPGLPRGVRGLLVRTPRNTMIAITPLLTAPEMTGVIGRLLTAADNDEASDAREDAR